MRILGRFCLLLLVCSVLELYKGILQAFLGWLLMIDCTSCLKFWSLSSDFKGGFFVFRCFLPAFNVLGLCLMFGLGLKWFKFSWYGKGLFRFLCGIRGKSRRSKNGFFSENVFDKLCGPNMMKFVEHSESGNGDDKSKELVNNPKTDVVDENCEKESSDSDEEYEELDCMALKRLVKIERLRADMAYAELEQERLATASAADEAMAMILKLQSEKSLLEIEANQYRKLAEQKQEYYEQVIQSLQWELMKQESEKTFLEENLRLCGQELKQNVESDEMESI